MELKLIHGCNRADEISQISFLYELEKEYKHTENAEILNRYLNKLIASHIDGYDIYRPDNVDKICKKLWEN